ncbi:uncharacterized protein EMH_0027990 [Eimeria mitis]|uniref:Transmembrane protein n=1 Tax=Eimeria mitis TaxID=44415 RepID=U6JQ46_9EIME|nr:uncharacterized protein EMH_0027990 [Eimeria mitis]CDJ26981.1 hypothetical protein, conserved [Eimeria mitis]
MSHCICSRIQHMTAPPAENASVGYVYLAGGIANILLPFGAGAIVCGIATQKRLLLHAGVLHLVLTFLCVGVLCSIVYGISMIAAAVTALKAAAADGEQQQALQQPAEDQQQQAGDIEQQQSGEMQQQQQQQSGELQQQHTGELQQQHTGQSIQRNATDDPVPYTDFQPQQQQQHQRRSDLCIHPSQDFIQ